MTGFLAPGWLWLLVAVAALVAFYIGLQLRRHQFSTRFSNTELLASLMPKRPGWRRHVSFGFVVLSLATLTVAMAKPTHLAKVPRDRATVVMAVDVSLSMQATDVRPNRLKAAQTAGKEFVRQLPPRINLGLVSFAGSASVLVSPSTDRDVVSSAINNLKLAESTAIGEAIFSSLTAIQSFQAQLSGSTGEKPPPARIVLMSDGTNTLGRGLDAAISAAKKANVPVSTIAFGTPNGDIDIDGQAIRVPADEDALRQIADETGGSFHSAATAEQLKDVYRDLGSQIGFTKKPRETTTWWVGFGLLSGFTAVGLSLVWTNRLL